MLESDKLYSSRVLFVAYRYEPCFGYHKRAWNSPTQFPRLGGSKQRLLAQSLCAIISAQTTTMENPYGYFINQTQHHHRCCGCCCDSRILIQSGQGFKSTRGQTCCDSTGEEVITARAPGWVRSPGCAYATYTYAVSIATMVSEPLLHQPRHGSTALWSISLAPACVLSGCFIRSMCYNVISRVE
jgi:hypothetical protein